ncbi:MAG: PilZ domain-containing protein [Terriglobia bacterium]
MYYVGMSDDQRTAKRRWERRRVQMAVTLVIEGDEAEYLSNTVDLSPQGLCLQSDATLALGQPVGLLLGTEPNCFIKARVAWVGKIGPDQPAHAGFEFLNTLPGPAC